MDKIIDIQMLLQHRDFLTKVGVWELISNVLNKACEEQHVEDWEHLNYNAITWTNYDVMVINDSITQIGAMEMLTEEAGEPNWFYVEDASGEGNTLSISMLFESDPSQIETSFDFYVSEDKENWTKLETLKSSSRPITYEFGENAKVYIRCNADTLGDWADDDWYNVVIDCSNDYNIGGNIMSLLYGSGFTGNETEFPQGSTYNFVELFSASETLISAENLLLPATTLVNYCYDGMFSGCKALTKAPELPATTLSEYCYAEMFAGCTALTTAPELPATTLATECYWRMFHVCTALTTAPELPATTLATECYSEMFAGCTALTTAPELPAIVLAEYCYKSMFSGCTALTTVPVLLATVLAEGCYYTMFGGCTALTTAPELLATTLATSCYSRMFDGCTALKSVVTHIEEWNTANTGYWLYEVAEQGTLYNIGGANIPTDDASGCPTGWTIVTKN